MIEATDLTGIDETLALRVLGHARSFAPCLDRIGDDPTNVEQARRDKETAVAILKGVATEARDRGSRLVKGQRVGPAGVDYTDVASWFGPDDRAALIALCGRAPAPAGPVGHFPKPGRISQLWPETY